MRAAIRAADETIRQSDLTVVCTERDLRFLVARGIDPGKLAAFPLGMNHERPAVIFGVRTPFPKTFPAGPPTIGFIGTFDPLKGMCEFPRIVDSVIRAYPSARFRLLGTAGMVPDAVGVLAHFPRHVRAAIDVRPRYEPEELPGLLAECAIGVFPSVVEGFPFGVLEMQAAAIPVVAYDAPGAEAMLPPDLLMPLRDADAIADRAIDLLANPEKLRMARTAARIRSRQFVWETIAKKTAERYLKALSSRHAHAV